MNNGDFLWLLTITVSQVLNLVATLYSFRRNPPVTEELYKDFATKDDLKEVCRKKDQELITHTQHEDDVHGEIFEIIRTMQKTHSEDLKIIERAVGKLEGLVEALSKHKTPS